MDGSFDPARRDLLRQLAFAPVGIAGAGALLWNPEAWAATGAGLPDMDPLVHFLRRTSFGVRPADLTAIRTSGQNAYLETQLAAAATGDPADSVARLYFPLAHLAPAAYWRAVFPSPAPAQGGDFAGHWPVLAGQVIGNVLYRALFSKRQLLEVMVQFWSNHLNTNEPHFKGSEQQTVIRAHALGNFRSMILASQRDTAMSRYLNNDINKSPVPNQNYARELLELHTLGEGRGYDQADVLALSAILTGHTWETDRASPNFGTYKYRPEWHVGGSKTFLGATVAGTGQTEINRALDLIFARPECGEYIAFKLCRHFVSDVPDHIVDIVPGDFVSRTAGVLRQSGYDIKTVLRYILKSPEFRASTDRKFMRPLEAGVSMLRAFDVQPTEALPDDLTSAAQEVIATAFQDSNPEFARNTRNAALSTGVSEFLFRYLRSAGNVPGMWPTPDGYPDVGSFWASATQFITRWNYIAQECERNVTQDLLLLNTGSNTRASARVPNVPTVARALVRTLADKLLHRPLQPEHETAVAAFVAGGNPDRLLTAAEVTYQASAVATVLLSSPYAQLR